MNWKGAHSSVLNFELRQWHTGDTFKKKSIKLYKTKIYSTPKMEIINKTQVWMESVCQTVWAKLTAEVCSGGGKVCKDKQNVLKFKFTCIVFLQSEACSAPRAVYG